MNTIPTPRRHPPQSVADIPVGVNYQIPNNLLHDAFGELNVTPRGDRIDIVLTVLLDPVKEGAQTGVALDGSASMQTAFGRGWIYTDRLDAAVIDRMKQENKAKSVIEDGQNLTQYTQAGWDELVNLGYVVQTSNEVEPKAREVIPYLADRIDADGGTTLIYWACGPRGDEIEVVGDLRSADASVASYTGPQNWGGGTHLLPAVKYFVERFKDAPWGFYVFVTDGRLDDLEAVKHYTADLSRAIGSGKRNDVKCVLLGVGNEIDEDQMEQLDDLPDAMDLPVDIWDHKISREMRGLKDIFAEVVNEHTNVAATGRVLDESGAVAASYADGVPSLMRFSLPISSASFTLEVGGNCVTQRLFS